MKISFRGKVWLSYFAVVAVAASSLMLTGCATVISGTTQNLNIGSNPSGLRYEVKNSSGMIVGQGTTPATLVARRGDGNLMVEVTGTDGRKASGVIRQGTNGWVFGNIALGGLIGVGVDIVDGAAHAYKPDFIMVNAR